MKFWNKQHFVENKTQVQQHVLKKGSKFLFFSPKWIKWISRGVFNAHLRYVNSGHFKVKAGP